ncbi:MAG: M20 metallopeptidase family protein [Anaerovoracaceae bacterium]
MDNSEKVQSLMKELEPDFIEVFRHLHQNPELSFKEFETTKYITDILRSLDIEILDYGLETGVVGLLKGSSDGPCIGLRADIDALPVKETSTCAFPSQRDGIMHACGHDVHTSSLLSAAMILSRMRDEIKGSVKFLFQPAEELNAGAKLMVRKGCLENPHVDAIFGLHNQPEIPSGTVAVVKGPLMAAVDRINIRITGVGGHGGVPQRSHDPVVAAASIIQAAQTIVSRNINPIDSAVVSICNVKAGEGTTNNVIPDYVTMYGTVRTYSSETAHLIERRIKDLVEQISSAYECKGECEYIYELPVTYGLKELHDQASDALSSVGIKPIEPDPTTGGEDFAVYQQEVPGYFYWLGVREEDNDCVHPWHSPKFKANEHVIKYGAGTYAMSVFFGIRAVLDGLPV